ncbi:hypothetical protein [Micromonospora sp. NPDC093277]|uniref:hypothetical protein n=1 Tax=Micromonospora sp. NPDC093277 TaxID=3364291 RepID=UPI003814AD54
MPASVAPAEKRPSSLYTVLFWIGVALAPLAALILLVADGSGSLRLGAVLAIFAVVLIGLSIALRAEGGDQAAGAEEMRTEIEQLRHELRSEIVAAAHRGNQALDQAQRMQETVTALHRRLDSAAAGMAAAAGAAPAAEEPAAARARVSPAESYAEGRSRRGAGPEQAPTGGGQPSGRDEDEQSRSQPGIRHGTDRPRSGVYGAPRTAEPDARSEPRPVGVVHHTETVHVTTRHTIVDGGADSGTGSRYGGYANRWSPVADEPRGSGAAPEERSWSGYREPAGDRGWTGGDQARPTQGEHWRGGSRSGPDGERDGPGGPRASWDERAPWDEMARSADRPAVGAARAGDGSGPGEDRGWAARQAERDSRSTGPAEQRAWSAADGRAGQRSWSSADGPAEQRSAAAAPAGAADERWRPAGRDGRRDELTRPTGPDGPRDEGSRAAGAGRHDGRDRADEGSWARSGRQDGRDRADEGTRTGRHDGPDRAGEGWTNPGVPAWTASEPSGREVATDDPEGAYWSELRVGNRWAAVRDDEHGREIQVGERRAAVHAAGAGTEYRVEDRWASVREPRRDHGVPGEAGPGWAEESRPALPAGGVPVPDEWRPATQQGGQPEWRREEPEPVRYGDERYGHPARDDAPRTTDRARSTDRWR